MQANKLENHKGCIYALDGANKTLQALGQRRASDNIRKCEDLSFLNLFEKVKALK